MVASAREPLNSFLKTLDLRPDGALFRKQGLAAAIKQRVVNTVEACLEELDRGEALPALCSKEEKVFAERLDAFGPHLTPSERSHYLGRLSRGLERLLEEFRTQKGRSPTSGEAQTLFAGAPGIGVREEVFREARAIVVQRMQQSFKQQFTR